MNDLLSKFNKITMEGNEWAAVVYTRWGNWPQPFDPTNCKVLAMGGRG